MNDIRDTFSCANSAVGSSWEGLTGTSFYVIASNKLDVGDPLVWKTSAFGTNSYATLSTIDSRSPSQGVLLKVQTGTILSAGAISEVYDAAAKAVRVSTLRLNTPAWTLYANVPAVFANGDVKIYRNGALITTVTLNAADKTFFNVKGGKIGIWAAGALNAIFEDFGGGSL